MGTQYPEIRKALGLLLNVCDGAAQRDGCGFNKFDSFFAESLASQAFWTYGQADAAYRMLRKYEGQLEAMDYPYDFITKPERPSDEPAEPLLPLDDYLKEIQFGEPKEVETKFGTKIVRTASLPDMFFTYWREYKEEIKKRGYSVSKYNGQWQVSLWRAKPKEDYTPPNPVFIDPAQL